jgi:hypothetical protein
MRRDKFPQKKIKECDVHKHVVCSSEAHMRLVHDQVLGYSVPNAAKAFSPPLSVKALRRSIRAGAIKTTVIGQRAYLLRDELIKAANEGRLANGSSGS